MVRTILTLLALACLSGCHGPSTYDALMDAVDTRCPNQESCEISLASVTNITWQQVYVFDEVASKQNIEKTMGISFDGYTAMSQHVIFVNDGMVVSYENYDYQPELTDERNISFDFFSEPRQWFYRIDKAHPQLRITVRREGAHAFYTAAPM